MVTIGIVGDFDPAKDTHAATDAALQHAAARLELELRSTWLPTDALDATALAAHAGLVIAPGSPYRDMLNVLAAIRHARERGVPCLGTCGGFQHMVLEYARNVLGVRAAHAEYEAAEGDLFITKLACSLRGRSMQLELDAGSQVAACYRSTSVTEQYYCSFGINPERLEQLRSGPLRFSGSDAEGEARVLELPGHPFFIGTLFVPQARSTASAPHPLLLELLRAAHSAP
jgi:CTP synthase (UTP-ammonia lyase)